MSDRIAWDAELLQAHAERVEQVGDDVKLAADAARSIDLGDGAFGLLCAFMIPPAAAVSAIAIQMIDSAGDLLTRTRTELEGMTGDVEENEQNLVDRIQELDDRVALARGA